MSAFPSSLSAFCAGDVPLSEVLTVLRADMSRDHRSLAKNISLVDEAWRSGRVGESEYRVLRDTITGFESGSHDAGQHGWSSGRAPRFDDGAQFDIDHEAPTRFRSSKRHPLDDPYRVRDERISAANNRSTGAPASWPDATPSEVPQGTVLKERFILEEEIGRGGMGTVFKARDLRKEEAQDRDPFVAVKVLNDDFRKHPQAFRALQREAKKSQSLAHPNVASVFDFDRDGSTVFIVMELLEGPSLQSLIESRAGRGLPRAEVFRIVQSAGAALAHAHKKGVIHSDFKPANVIRTFEGTVKVLDFGIARAFVADPQEVSATTRFDPASLRALTPAYASPEMLLGQPADPRDDVFALACVTYELLAGRHPFGYATAADAQRDEAKLVPIANVDRKTWRALQRALAFSRTERTASVTEFLQELQPVARSRIALIVGATASAVLVVGAGAYWAATQPTNKPIEVPSMPSASVTRVEPNPAGNAAIEQEATPRAVEIREQPRAQQSSPAMNSEPPRIATAPQIASSMPALNTQPKPGQREQVQQMEERPRAPTTLQPQRPRELSATQLKERAISLARVDEIPDALTALQELKSKSSPNDAVVGEVATAIAHSYGRLAERAIAAGQFTSAIALLTRADEMSSSSSYVSRREQVQRIERVAESLESGTRLSAEPLRTELGLIREAEGPQYYLVRSSLAKTLIERIRNQPDSSASLVALAQELFPGVPEVDALAESSASRDKSSNASL